MWALEPGSASRSPLQVDTRSRTDRLNISSFIVFFRFVLMDTILGTLCAMGETQYQEILDDKRDEEEGDDWLSTRAGVELIWTGPWDAVLKISEFLWDLPNYALFLAYGKGHKRAMTQIQDQVARARVRELTVRAEAQARDESTEESRAADQGDPEKTPTKKQSR